MSLQQGSHTTCGLYPAQGATPRTGDKWGGDATRYGAPLGRCVGNKGAKTVALTPAPSLTLTSPLPDLDLAHKQPATQIGPGHQVNLIPLPYNIQFGNFLYVLEIDHKKQKVTLLQRKIWSHCYDSEDKIFFPKLNLIYI